MKPARARDLKPANTPLAESDGVLVVNVRAASDETEQAIEDWLVSLLEGRGTPGESGRP